MITAQAGLVIGPSTGWLYAREIYSLREHETVLKQTGANCLEISLWKRVDNDRRILSLKEYAFDETFIYRSLHLPDIGQMKPEHQIIVAQDIVRRFKAAVTLIHPLKVGGDYPTDIYRKMIVNDIPLAIENMDSRKDSGFNLAELERLVNTINCRFVLDVQHAYEHDHEMKYAGDLLETLKDSLAHLHVSGETRTNIHSLVYKAANAGKIVEFVRQALAVKNVPLILEGEYTTADELRREIEFLKKEFGGVK